MKHPDPDRLPCPIARSLERIGDGWTMLILRDAFAGMSRFDQFQKSLRIAPNILTNRLAHLVEAGLLTRRPYRERPLRYEYLPTEMARDFRPVMWMLIAWGTRHFSPEGPTVVMVDRETGAIADPIVVDRISGKPMTPRTFRPAAGPAGDESVRRRYANYPVEPAHPTDAEA